MFLEEYAEDDGYYRELAEEIIEHEIQWIKTADIRIAYITSNKAKKSKGKIVMGECLKIKEIYKMYIPYDFFIIIYEPNCEGLTEEQLKILLHHELLHIDVSESKGEPVYNINPHDIEDFRAIIDKYGVDWSK